MWTHPCFSKHWLKGSHWIEAFHCQIQCQGSFNWNNLSHSFSNFEPDILYVISFFVKRQNISNERIVEWTFFLNLVQWEKLWSFSWAFPVYFHYNWLQRAYFLVSIGIFNLCSGKRISLLSQLIFINLQGLSAYLTHFLTRNIFQIVLKIEQISYLWTVSLAWKSEILQRKY